MRRTLVRLRHDWVRFHVLAALLLLCGAAFAGTDEMSCNTSLPSHHSELAAGDQNTASHLQLSRPLAAGAEVDLDQCSGDLSLVASKNGQFKVTVDLGQPVSPHMAGDYLELLDISPHKAVVHLHLPKSVQAKVIVEIPGTVPEVEVNLARGDLKLMADQVRGERQINVGYGQVRVQGNDDTYESMEINVGLGSLHDHRNGGENHHLIVAHSFAGSGKGRIEINLGMGHVDVYPSQAQPI
jgi:hypothetical protein